MRHVSPFGYEKNGPGERKLVILKWRNEILNETILQGTLVSGGQRRCSVLHSRLN